MTPRTACGLIKCRPAAAGSRVAIVAPASAFKQEDFDAGVAELRRLGFEPVFSESVFEREPIVAGSIAARTRALMDAWRDRGIDAIVAVRGGYGSVEVLPGLDPAEVAASRTALVGYSDITSLHTFLNCHAGLVSIHGPMLEGRLAAGTSAYDAATFLTALSVKALGEQSPDGLTALKSGEAVGSLFGGTISQLVGSLGTPWPFAPPAGAVLFLDEVGERPYRIRRMLTQLQQAGVLSRASAIVCGQFPRCDEPDGVVTGRGQVADVFRDFSGPVLFGYPSGHTVTPLFTVPFGVAVRAIGGPRPRLVFDEAAAAA
ncbi:MAG TPA: LD-carboxypeptidase [Vicinamibacterales bacterium]|nr:LD-carboxypeptidase [Vicinamibacterales bacterium]